jgi:hypothetical protein
MERNDTKRLSWKAGLVAGVLLALSPALAVAQQGQTPYATAMLYEVREDINCNPGDSTAPNCADGAKGFGVRIADATLTGNIFSRTQTDFVGPVTLDASSILNQQDWTGPAHGKMTLQNGVRATFSGQLNLSLAMFANQPLAPLSGKWQGTKGTLHAGGDFSGFFLIPVPLGCSRDTAPGCFYLELGADGKPTGQFLPLQPEEYTSEGAGLVKLMVAFFNN